MQNIEASGLVQIPVGSNKHDVTYCSPPSMGERVTRAFNQSVTRDSGVVRHEKQVAVISFSYKAASDK